MFSSSFTLNLPFRGLLILSYMGCTADKLADDSSVQGVETSKYLQPLSVSSDYKIVDPNDNQVLLRGVNITSLGEYWQGNPNFPATLPTTEMDFQAMANRGISVIRLIVHWSRLEPTAGEINVEYLDEIDEMVSLAAKYNIYTVIDMHQDAYSAFIYTSVDEDCPDGTTPGKGWDGAPEWATITDGLSTCIEGERNSAPAVIAAWNHFYDNTDGIQDHFVESWGAIAERFAGRPEVAGYDLLNEPETSRPASELLPLYEGLLTAVISEIQEAESEADFQHLIFIEPTIPAADVVMGLGIPDPERMGVQNQNVVNATHNYAESIEIGGLSLEQTNSLLVALAQTQQTPLWIGEYGFWSTDSEVLSIAERFAVDEDNHGLGGAWWQWRQPCGDPHSVHLVDGEWVPYDEVVHLHTMDCTTNTEIGATEELLQILGRGYPRVTAGRIRTLESDIHTGRLFLEGEALASGQSLVVWTPTSESTHQIVADRMEDLHSEPIDGGRLISGVIPDMGRYTFEIKEVSE